MPGTTSVPEIELIVEDIGGGGGGKPPAGGDDGDGGGDDDKRRRKQKMEGRIANLHSVSAAD